MSFDRILSTSNREQLAKYNILVSIGLKGIDTFVYLALVPLTIGYLNAYEYGIWLTINSILMWVNSFDIGLGNGLRNKLAEAIALKDTNKAKSYVSSTFAMLIGLVTIILLLGLFILYKINWYSIINTTQELVPNLSNVIIISFVIFCINFILKIITNIYQGLQLPAISNAMNVCGHVLSLIIIYFLTKTTEGNLLYVAIAYSLSPTLIYIVVYPFTFLKFFKYLSPSVGYVKWIYIKSLCNLSVNFFFLQIAGILLFSMTNVLISNMFGPESVTPYNIAYRYFSLAQMALSLIMTPIWSATTDAYSNEDYPWIKNALSKVVKFNIFATISICFMIIFSPIFYRFWLHSAVSIPIGVTALMAFYIIVIVWSLSFSSFLNGMGILRIQTINTIGMAILFIPICYFLGKMYEIEGILIGMILINIPGLILNVVQLYKVINNRNGAIWYK